MEFKEVSAKDVKEFIDKYHLHGFLPASKYYALYNKDEIVQVMTVKIFNDYVEISRLVSKSGCLVIGGFQKLLKNMIRQLNPAKIISYAYRDITPDYKDSVYFKAGFTFDGYTNPGLFFYVKKDFTTPNGTFLKEGVYSRIKFQSHKLFKDFGFTEPLKSYGIYKVYDSGNLKFSLYPV